MKNQNYWRAAELLNKVYKAESVQERNLLNYDNVIFYDDDITVVLEGAKLWFKLKALYGDKGAVMRQPRRAIFLGGKGLMSSWLYKETEGRHLASVATKMGIEKERQVILDQGTNTGECLRELRRYLCPPGIVYSGRCLIVVTQRLSLILKQSIALQWPQLDADYYVIEQSVEESCRLYNGMALAGGRPLLHFWAHVVNRFDRYNGLFMIKPFEPAPEVREAGDLLAQNFLIKQRVNSLRKYLQYVPILWDLLRKRKAICRAEAEAIAEAKKSL